MQDIQRLTLELLLKKDLRIIRFPVRTGHTTSQLVPRVLIMGSRSPQLPAIELRDHLYFNTTPLHPRPLKSLPSVIRIHQCLTHPKIPRPMTRMLHRSRLGYPLGRGVPFTGSFLSQYYMVSRSAHLSILAHLSCHCRDCRFFVLQMCGRLAWPQQSHQGRYKMGTRGPHCSNVLFYDDTHGDLPS